jgi:Ca2+-binding RTX toxin-like protein
VSTHTVGFRWKWVTGAVVLVVVVGAAGYNDLSASLASEAACLGLDATIVGTEDGDDLAGTVGDDVIVGFGGNDRLRGTGGNDLLCGGSGADTILGGLGDDRLDGNGGDDFLDGKEGSDELNGRKGIDLCLNGESLAKCEADEWGGPDFEFAVMGDVPYNEKQALAAQNLLRETNGEQLAFSVHVGDFKSGDAPCSDDVYYAAAELLNESTHPLVYTPGDNEWTDCHRTGFDPLERLGFLRSVLFSSGAPLGDPELELTSQSIEYPENVRWRYGGIMFLTLHVVGDNNNLGNTPEGDSEFAARSAANLEWLQEGFDLAAAENSLAIVVFMHGNPGFELRGEHRTGFNAVLDALEHNTLVFKNPVVLVHGDTHYFRIDKPMVASMTDKRVENFSRVESFGSPDVHWIRVSIDLDDPEVLSFSPEIVEANLEPTGRG